ncbi:hypothetical protein M8C17_17965 [Micromonospora sp. RHAY321]|uniref:hypothetical protein n=1 Tax=Micromonospora sp. RHAY321 TaxID=2944807 RepID=UPI00207D134D|nr:hypothetical protein [Micromonospora sp. RHAY321]MCO1597044.1 hypothetical protein [Micromonospora sp. RHAY321]
MRRRPNRRRQMWQAAAMVVTAAAFAGAVIRAKRRTAGDHADSGSLGLQEGAFGAGTTFASPAGEGAGANRSVTAAR